ncbi:MAG: hypothetical protein JW801_08505 [Bacteroidales bacterium]|nr:hypothetical protein [Bacteroidales bacterium]
MKRIFTILGVLALTLNLLAKGDSLSVRPFQLSVVYPLSTAGVHAADQGYTISLNLLSGVTGAAHGIELGGISNVNKYYNKGIQFGGISNINGTYNQGVQFAGICNITGTYSGGAQFGGICNITGGGVHGLQTAGISNVSGTDLTGIQAAGISNISGGTSRGAQLAGIGNVADSLIGIQAAGIINIADDAKALQLGGIGNIADDVNGAQVGGIFNIADDVKGMQLAGILNICDSIHGVPIALISIVGKNGYRRLQVWTSEAFPVNVSFKTGVRAFYTMFSLGYRPGNIENNTGLGYGIGTNHSIGKRSSLELEAHMYHINHFLWVNEDNFLYTLKLNYERQIWNRLSVFAGPSINMMMARPLSDASLIAPSWARETSTANYDWQYWVGFNAGVRF